MICRYARQIDRLEARAAMLEKKLDDVALAYSQEAPVNALPPHYMPTSF